MQRGEEDRGRNNKIVYFRSVLFHCSLPFYSIPVSCVVVTLPAVKDFKSHPDRGGGGWGVVPKVQHTQKNNKQCVVHILHVLAKLGTQRWTRKQTFSYLKMFCQVGRVLYNHLFDGLESMLCSANHLFLNTAACRSSSVFREGGAHEKKSTTEERKAVR